MKEVMPHIQQQEHLVPPFNVVNLGMVVTRFGPVIPPDMQWEKVMSRMMPTLYFCTIPVPCKESKFSALNLHRLPTSWVQSGINGKKLMKVQGAVGVLQWKEGYNYNLLGEPEENKRSSEESIPVTATPIVRNKRRVIKSKPQLVQSVERRFTRSCLKEGYKPKPVLSVQPKIKKKSRAKLLIQNAEEKEEDNCQDKEGSKAPEEIYLVTPVHVLQRVGLSLGIAPSMLTQEHLEGEAKKGEKSTMKNE
jgi:hypothetical protein